MYCPTCGADVDDQPKFCPDCGADLRERLGDREPSDAGADESPSSPEAGGGDGDADPAPPPEQRPSPARASPSTQGRIPAGAAAIDIACPLCGKRPIEEMAKGHRLNAWLLFYTRRSYELVGCHACIRRKLWGMSAKNLILGWWGIKAAALNVALTGKNLVRGAVNRGPNTNLQSALEHVGVTYDYLDDPNAFDPAAHSPDELYIRSFVRLGTAIMLADGLAHPEERQTLHDTITLLVPGYPATKLDELIERASQTEADVERVAEGIGELLGEEGKQLVIAFVAAIADAGVTGDEDIELVATIARALDFSEDDIKATLAAATPAPTSPPS